jgi:hypothetical protein
MEAKLGNKPSKVGKSFLAAKELIYSGVLWRVGDGRDVNIWGDPWIPMPTSFSVQSPRIESMGGMKVSSLIDQDTKQWKRPLIAEIFTLKKLLSPIFR